MDFLSSERPNLDVDDDIAEFFNNDVFSSNETVHNDYIHDDWFKNLFDDPVLNDKMITDAAPPRISSEHSYSIDTDDACGVVKMEDFSRDNVLTMVDRSRHDAVDSKGCEFFNALLGYPCSCESDGCEWVPMSVPWFDSDSPVADLGNDFFTNNGALDLSQKTCTPIPTCPKRELPDPSYPTHVTPTPYITLPSLTKAHTPATIIITTPGENHTYSYTRPAHTLIPKAHIKVEPIDTLDQVITESGIAESILPPTPPHSSSSCSDSDGSLSPLRSAPPSPGLHMSQFSPPISRHPSKPFIQPIFTNPIPTSGVLILTEEEKRTLVQEGYPIPAKLPLTKNEEKNLKKIRRKIKNKISAQESRRKKKEYLELLEKQVECYTHENSDLKRKVDSLECNNKSLLGQLQKLQSLVGKSLSGNVSSTPAGSMLMVVVLCFAMFLGNWAPSSLNIGYSVGSVGLGADGIARPNLYHPAPNVGPPVQKVHIDSYTTPNMKSRMLLSLREECPDDEGYGPHMPMLIPDMCGKSEHDSDKPHAPKAPKVEPKAPLPLHRPKAARVYVNPEIENNETSETVPQYGDDIAHALMHPDIAAPAIQNLTVAAQHAHETA